MNTGSVHLKSQSTEEHNYSVEPAEPGGTKQVAYPRQRRGYLSSNVPPPETGAPKGISATGVKQAYPPHCVPILMLCMLYSAFSKVWLPYNRTFQKSKCSSAELHSFYFTCTISSVLG